MGHINVIYVNTLLASQVVTIVQAKRSSLTRAAKAIQDGYKFIHFKSIRAGLAVCHQNGLVPERWP